MAVSYNDKYQLSQSVGFQNRVQAALLAGAVAVANEGWTIAFHRERADLARQILLSPSGTTNYVQLFSNVCANDTNVINDATATGTVTLTSGNRETQQASVTDAHIDAAISASYNAFCREPS